MFSRLASATSVELRRQQPKPVVVVPVAGFVPVTIGRAAVPGFVVPTTAPQDPVIARLAKPQSV